MTILTQASNQWATRPADERFTSLTDLAAHTKRQRDLSAARILPSKGILAAPVEGDHRALVVIDKASGAPVSPTHWSFGQLAGRISAPAGYLRDLPAEIAADCVNWGLKEKASQDIGVLLRQDGGQLPTMAAVTGPQYGRIWNDEITSALVSRFGDGITGDFRVPGEFGKAVEVTKDNTTLFAGDRDMFVFLADEEHKIEMKDRRNGPGLLSRGFFVWNSEVGSQTLGIATFLFDYTCSNRIVWGVEGFKELRVRHTSGAPDRWLDQVRPALIRMANSETHSITDAIAAAQAAKLGDTDDVTAFMEKRFTKSQVKAINLAHEAEEQRPIETLWDAVTGATAYARSIEFQDQRVEIERKAGGILDLAKSRAA